MRTYACTMQYMESIHIGTAPLAGHGGGFSDPHARVLSLFYRNNFCGKTSNFSLLFIHVLLPPSLPPSLSLSICQYRRTMTIFFCLSSLTATVVQKRLTPSSPRGERFSSPATSSASSTSWYVPPVLVKTPLEASARVWLLQVKESDHLTPSNVPRPAFGGKPSRV